MVHLAHQFISDAVSYSQFENIAFLTIQNLPVNGLGDTVRQGLYSGLEQAKNDPEIQTIVICGEGKMFSGGADIRQFNTPKANAKPMLRDVIKKISQSVKPVIAAIHGAALGGGLELALGCHYRIASSDTKLGLPEVNLGLLPGGGGTQRLPRLIGVEAAARMIVNATMIKSQKALELGLIDQVVSIDILDAAIDFAKKRLAKGDQKHPVIEHLPLNRSEAQIETVRNELNPKARNARAQRAALDCVAHAGTVDFEQGLDYERARFEELVKGIESHSLRHIFFAEKQALKVKDLTDEIKAFSITSVGVIGAGTMGTGIAMAFANAGIPVTLCEVNQTALDRGLATIRKNYEATGAKGKISPEEIERRIASISSSTNLASIAQVDLVIEAVFEDMEVKKKLFVELDHICKSGAILASNTSRLDVNEIASVTSRPQDVIGLHFFSPANVMRLLEVVRGSKTSLEVIATCMSMAQKIGKTPVLVGVCEGFVGNRMLTPYWREAWFLLEEGATPNQIDHALTDFGMAMGPLRMADLAGLDINWVTRKRLAPTRRPDLRYSKVADRICEAGRFGQKTGAGFYKYSPGSRLPEPDPVVDEMIKECALEAGITRRSITDAEIVERCMLALINEACWILQEGIAQRSSDVDVVYVNGYGFPAWRGGPLFYAETLGWKNVYEKLLKLRVAQGDHWAISPYLIAKAEGIASAST